MLVPVIFLCHDVKSNADFHRVWNSFDTSILRYCTGFNHIVFRPGTMTTHLDASDHAVRHDEAEYSTGSSEVDSCSEIEDSDTEGVLSELSSCPDWDEIEAEVKESATAYPEPEGEDDSLAVVSKRVYTPINGLWQTRILQLLPGSVGSALHAKLIVADIVIRPGLVLHKDQRLISYGALSYSCGEPILARRIYLQGESFPITENLYLGLQSIRKSKEPMFLWVDAICIHQADREEKSQQVVNMLDIYRKADHVHVWLGPCGENTELAFSFLSAAENEIGSHVTKCPDCLKRLLEGVEEIFGRSWFRRTWVKQEIYASKHITTHCGHLAFMGDFVLVWTANLRSLIGSRARQPDRRIRNLDASAVAAEVDIIPSADHKGIINKALQKLGSFHRANPGELVARNDDEKQNRLLVDDPSHSLDIINVMRRCSKSECSDLRDHVYALLGMTNLKHHTGDTVCGDDNALIVDYSKSVAQILEELTRYIIHRDQSLAVLCLEVPYGRDLSQSHLAMLPSWVPDLRFQDRGRSWLQIPEIRNAYSDMDLGEHHGLDQLHPLHESGNLSGRYLGGCDAEPLERQSLYEDAPLHDDQTGCTSRDDPNSVTQAALISLSDSQLRLIGISVGSITFDREPFVTEWFRSNDPLRWNIFHEGHLNRGRLSAELLQSASLASVILEIEVKDTTLQSIFNAIDNELLSLRVQGRLPSSRGTRILIKITSLQYSELLGVVSVAVVPPAWYRSGSSGFTAWYESGGSGPKIVALDDLLIARCWYTDDLVAGMDKLDDYVKRDGPLTARLQLGQDNLPASWLVPKSARSGDLILLATGSPLPLLVRPRPSSLTYEFVGQAMPCQTAREDTFPSSVLLRLIRLIKHLGASSRSTAEFVLE
jgi:hypothetical protein